MRSGKLFRSLSLLYFAVMAIPFFSSAVLAEDAKLTIDEQKTKAVIRDIRVEVKDIFEDESAGVFYNVVNEAKASTKVAVVKRELLFKEGDVFDEFLIEESIRNLRSLPFLRKARITPFFSGDVVDIVVSVQDTWTVYPQLGFSSGGGTKKQSIGLVEGNLLGWGKRAEVLYAEDEDRQRIEGVWDDRRLFGMYQRLLVGHFQRSDGFKNVLYYGRPFRSLVEPYSWSLNSDNSDLVSKLYRDGEENYLFRQRHVDLSAGYTLSNGNPEQRLYRLTFAYDFSKDEFREADENDFEDVNVDPDSVSRDPSFLAEDRLFSGPSVRIQSIEPDYISLNYIDRFERVEDFNLGWETNASAGIAPELLGSERNTTLLSFGQSKGTRFSPTSFLRGEIGAAARANSVGLQNVLLRGEMRYYNVLGAQYVSDLYVGRHTLASSISMDAGESLDRDRQFVLGASTALRGYKDRALTGDYRFVANIEDRFHLVEDIYKLVSLGGAVFFDVGGTSETSLGNLFSDEIRSDVGVGLRLGLPRSSNNSVIRIDVAFPLRNAADGSEQFSPRLLITLNQAFSAKLRTEALGPERANVSIGLPQ